MGWFFFLSFCLSVFLSLSFFFLSYTYRHAPLDYLAYVSPEREREREIIAHVWTAGPMETSLVAKRVKPSSCALSRLKRERGGERERVKTTMNKDVIGVWTDLTEWVLDPLSSDRPVLFEGGISWGCRRRRRKKKHAVQTA